MNRATTGWNRIVSLIIWVVAGGFLVSALSFLTIVLALVWIGIARYAGDRFREMTEDS